MNAEQLHEYCLSLGGVEEKFPFGKFARRYDSLLVFYVCGHMFCMADLDDFTSVSLRSTADEIEEIMLNHTAASLPRANMRLWLNIEFGGDISDTMIFNLITRAYNIVKEKYRPKIKSK